MDVYGLVLCAVLVELESGGPGRVAQSIVAGEGEGAAASWRCDMDAAAVVSAHLCALYWGRRVCTPPAARSMWGEAGGRKREKGSEGGGGQEREQRGQAVGAPPPLKTMLYAVPSQSPWLRWCLPHGLSHRDRHRLRRPSRGMAVKGR